MKPKAGDKLALLLGGRRKAFVPTQQNLVLESKEQFALKPEPTVIDVLPYVDYAAKVFEPPKYKLLPRTSKPPWRTREEIEHLLWRHHKDVMLQLIASPHLIEGDQVSAVVDLVWRLCELPEDHEFGGNSQCIAPTGAGKMYVICAVTALVRRIAPERYPKWKAIIILEPPAAVPQTMEPLAQMGVLNDGSVTFVTSLQSLRGKIGQGLFTWQTKIVDNQAVLYPIINPGRVCLIWVDESQMVKNESSQQAMMITSAAACNVRVIPVSATPYSRPSQARVIACALRPKVRYGHSEVLLTNDIWASYISSLCHPNYPHAWSPTSLRRLQEVLEPKTVRFTCEYPFPIKSRVVRIRFSCEEDRQRYMEAFEEWQAKRAQFDKNPLAGFAAVLVALAKFLQVAEEIRAPYLAQHAAKMLREADERPKRGKLKPAIILGFVHRTSLDLAKLELEKLGYDQKRVAMICGGQSEGTRERNKQMFMTDRAPLCLLTIACGGAALSLDHNKYNSRQRHMFCSATWNDIQMAQLAGRTQRIKTCSASHMYIFCYEGTEEIKRWEKLKRKLTALSQITTKAQVKMRDAKHEVGTFVGDSHQIEDLSDEDTHVNSLELPTTKLLSDEERQAIEEEHAARILGVTAKVNIELEDDENVDDGTLV